MDFLLHINIFGANVSVKKEKKIFWKLHTVKILDKYSIVCHRDQENKFSLLFGSQFYQKATNYPAHTYDTITRNKPKYKIRKSDWFFFIVYQLLIGKAKTLFGLQK